MPLIAQHTLMKYASRNRGIWKFGRTILSLSIYIFPSFLSLFERANIIAERLSPGILLFGRRGVVGGGRTKVVKIGSLEEEGGPSHKSPSRWNNGNPGISCNDRRSDEWWSRDEILRRTFSLVRRSSKTAKRAVFALSFQSPYLKSRAYSR